MIFLVFPVQIGFIHRHSIRPRSARCAMPWPNSGSGVDATALGPSGSMSMARNVGNSLMNPARRLISRLWTMLDQQFALPLSQRGAHALHAARRWGPDLWRALSPFQRLVTGMAMAVALGLSCWFIFPHFQPHQPTQAVQEDC